MRNPARTQVPPAPVHAAQRERAARLRDTAGRFAKSQETAAASPELAALPPPQDAPSRDTVPVSADAPEGTYALEITGLGLGRHADPGAAVIVVPEIPTGAGLAVFYLKDKPGPVIFDLTHHFQPEFARPFKAGSGVVPLIEVVEPRTGRVGHLSAERVEKIHRIIGVYGDINLPSKYGPRPPKLPLLNECPEGMGEHYADDAGAYPMVRRGETVVYDPGKREPTHGALCVMQWNNGVRDVMLTNLRPVGGMGEDLWWVDPVNRLGDRTVFTSDGPYDVDHLRGKIVGTVVGVLVPQRAGEPAREVGAEVASAPVPLDEADEIYAAAEREREAAEQAALDDTGRMSAVSPDLRAAIVRHGEVMQETQLRYNETDEEFDRDAGMQMAAEYAVAHAPVRTLADLSAKLTYLVPIIVCDLADHTHGGHLTAIRDDADQLCRRVVGLAAPVDASDLASACIQQAERLAAWDARPGGLSEAEGDAEMDRSCAVFKRAIAEPSDTLRTMAGKAVLMLDDLDRFYPVERHSTDNFLLMRTILREIITQGTTSEIATVSFNAKGFRP